MPSGAGLAWDCIDTCIDLIRNTQYAGLQATPPGARAAPHGEMTSNVAQEKGTF
ncbi:hypothetical protein COCCADRAFT_10544 [Bipolaris zeicola 26-R-13]|uniref:Uncharacterized protein n=1 Tax=Cochliobolus carbonum (strain 26-R-13) TaxID=930089 RepID=W6XV48_COCC2|nr:uncharacterized protein COCCADRAFT_10544 [Bipolaris zeicola 26-R-13]EUC26654.1 hypothetical protein COCCADRAFT_10544 [Bipolaris zeicola 26-R-13]